VKLRKADSQKAPDVPRGDYALPAL
jgi:hypothetical protein